MVEELIDCDDDEESFCVFCNFENVSFDLIFWAVWVWNSIFQSPHSLKSLFWIYIKQKQVIKASTKNIKKSIWASCRHRMISFTKTR